MIRKDVTKDYTDGGIFILSVATVPDVIAGQNVFNQSSVSGACDYFDKYNNQYDNIIPFSWEHIPTRRKCKKVDPKKGGKVLQNEPEYGPIAILLPNTYTKSMIIPSDDSGSLNVSISPDYYREKKSVMAEAIDVEPASIEFPDSPTIKAVKAADDFESIYDSTPLSIEEIDIKINNSAKIDDIREVSCQEDITNQEEKGIQNTKTRREFKFKNFRPIKRLLGLKKPKKPNWLHKKELKRCLKACNPIEIYRKYKWNKWIRNNVSRGNSRRP